MSSLATRLARFSSVSSLNSTDVPAPGAGRGHPGARLPPARPVRAGRHAVVVRRAEGGCAGLLPLGVLQRLHQRDERHPRPARRVPHLRHRGARDLHRPDVLAAGLRRHRRAQLPAAQRLLAARRRRRRRTACSTPSWGSPGARRSWSTRRGSCAGRCTTSCPTAATWRSTWPTCITWPRPAGSFSIKWPFRCWNCRACVGTVLLVEPLVTRDASGSTHFLRPCPGSPTAPRARFAAWQSPRVRRRDGRVRERARRTSASPSPTRLGCDFLEGDDLHPPANVAKMAARCAVDRRRPLALAGGDRQRGSTYVGAPAAARWSPAPPCAARYRDPLRRSARA